MAFPQTSIHRVITCPGNSTCRYAPKRTEKLYLHNLYLNVRRSIVKKTTKIWNNSNTLQLINKYPWFIQGDQASKQAVENYLAMKTNEALIHVAKCSNLENIMWWKDRKNATYFMMLIIWNVQERQIHKVDLLLPST